MSEPSSPAGTVMGRRVPAASKAAQLLLAFIAGFVAVVLFQQGVRAALMAAGAASSTAYSLAPAATTGVPRLVARAFWGGVWGMLLALVEWRVPRRPAYAFWIVALAFGALVPSFFAWFVVAPLKGDALAAGGDPLRLGVTVASNAAWGLGTAALLRALLALWPRPSRSQLF